MLEHLMNIATWFSSIFLSSVVAGTGLLLGVKFGLHVFGHFMLVQRVVALDTSSFSEEKEEGKVLMNDKIKIMMKSWFSEKKRTWEEAHNRWGHLAELAWKEGHISVSDVEAVWLDEPEPEE